MLLAAAGAVAARLLVTCAQTAGRSHEGKDAIIAIPEDLVAIALAYPDCYFITDACRLLRYAFGLTPNSIRNARLKLDTSRKQQS